MAFDRGEFEADHDRPASVGTKVPETSSSASSIDDLFEEVDTGNNVDTTADADVNGKDASLNPNITLNKDDAPADDEPEEYFAERQTILATQDLPTIAANISANEDPAAVPSWPENDFDRMIRAQDEEHENGRRWHPFDFTQFTPDDVGRLEDTLNDLAEDFRFCYPKGRLRWCHPSLCRLLIHSALHRYYHQRSTTFSPQMVTA